MGSWGSYMVNQLENKLQTLTVERDQLQARVEELEARLVAAKLVTRALEDRLANKIRQPLSRSEARRLAHAAPSVLEEKHWAAVKRAEAAERIASYVASGDCELETRCDIGPSEDCDHCHLKLLVEEWRLTQPAQPEPEPDTRREGE